MRVIDAGIDDRDRLAAAIDAGVIRHRHILPDELGIDIPWASAIEWRLTQPRRTGQRRKRGRQQSAAFEDLEIKAFHRRPEASASPNETAGACQEMFADRSAPGAHYRTC